MTVGVARVTLYLEDTFSLKDKRQVTRSITQKVRNQFNAGIAEVADLDDPRAATLAIVVVSNAANHAQEMLQTVIDFIERRVELGVLGEVETELIPYGDYRKTQVITAGHARPPLVHPLPAHRAGCPLGGGWGEGSRGVAGSRRRQATGVPIAAPGISSGVMAAITIDSGSCPLLRSSPATSGGRTK